MRRVNQTPPFANAYSMNSRNPDVRPACPAQRGCSPIDIIFGYPAAPSRHSSSSPRLHVVTILLAQLIPAHYGQDTLQAFNRALPALATEKTSSASPVLVVDQWSGFDPHRNTYDGLHPNEAGEKKMAQQWYKALHRLWPDTRGERP